MTKQYKDRLKILEDHEIDELYGLPRFDSDEQSYYFSLTQEERDLANNHRSIENRVLFILQAGYFYRFDQIPKAFIPQGMKAYIYEEDEHGKNRIHPDKYEFLVYRLLGNHIEAGDIYVRDSLRFRSFEDDLLMFYKQCGFAPCSNHKKVPKELLEKYQWCKKKYTQPTSSLVLEKL